MGSLADQRRSFLGSLAAPVNDVDYASNPRLATLENALTIGGAAGTSIGVKHKTNDFGPFDSGMTSWSYDPTYIRNNKTAVNGTLYLVKLWVREDVNILNIFWAQMTAGASPVAGQNWAGLYNSSGVLVGSSNIDAKVDDASGLVEGNVGPLPNGVLVPYTPPNNWVRAAFLFNAGTPPVMGCTTQNIALSNIGLEAFAPRYCTGGTGLTTLPANLGALTASADALFASCTAL